MRILVTILLAALIVGAAVGQTSVTGPINKDSTWTRARSPFIVTGNVTVQGGFTLRVDSGVVVRFQSGTNLYSTYGNVIARHAIFTSAKDTIGGTPLKGDWGSVYLGEYNFSTASALDSCQLRYGGGQNNAIVYIRNGSTQLRGTIVTNSSTNGVYVYGGTAALTQCQITNSTNSGLVVQAGTSTTVTDCINGPNDWPIWYEGGASSLVFNGVNNFPGNKHNGAFLNFTSTGNVTLDTLSIPYVFPISYDFTINAGGTMTIASGNVIKMTNSIIVRGALRAVAGVGQKIYFTSYRDDNLPTPGSDTNFDGTATAPAPSNWGGVQFQDESSDGLGVMRRCVLQYGGGGNIGVVSMFNAGPTIDSCEMKNSYIGAMLQYASAPIFSNNSIGSSTRVPIAMSFAAAPVFTNNSFSFSDNQYDAIGLLGGTLTADADLPIRSVTSIPNVTYYMLEAVTVPAGRTMTIRKGVVIKADVYYHRIVVQGKLIANATADSMIVFTSAKDDNFGNPGDTNKDGTQTVPAKGDWSGIVFEAGSDTTSILNYCRLSFASLSSSYYNTKYIGGGAVTTVNASPTISNCVLKDVPYGVYAFQSSNPKIVNDTIVNTTYTPIALSVSANPVMSGLTFVNVKWRALGIIGEVLGASGTIQQRSVGGFSNITYVLLEDLSINSGTTVTVNPGVVIKVNNGVTIDVNGAFRAKGTIAGGQVIFTSLPDDNYGNPFDTNGDGSASAPARGNWNTIHFEPTSDDVVSLLDSVLIKYNNTGVLYTDAGSTVSNSLLSDGNYYGVSSEGQSSPTVNNVTIQNFRLDPLAMSLKANPTFINITFAANGSRGIFILEGTLASDALLYKRDVAGISNIAYIINSLTIAPTSVFTVAPGVVIKFGVYYGGINVQGAMIARGTPTEKIIFTSIADDSKGGDTNNDANGSTPARGNWALIDFNASSTDSLNVLRNCEFRYGGGYYSNGVVRANNSRLLVDSCIVQQSASSAFGAIGSARPTFSNNEISNISSTPVLMSMFAQPTFSNNTANNIAYMALGIVPENYSVSATIPIRSFAGYNNITYYFNGDCSINSGTTITVPAGIVIKGGGFVVNGAIKVLGTPSQPVVFTDSRDDASGNPGDSNGDGIATAPTIGGGQSIYFADVSADTASVLRNGIFRFRDFGVYLQQASPVITNCRFDRDNWGIVLNGVSTPVVDTCEFSNLTASPLYMSLVSYPSSTVGNTLSGRTYRALGVINNESLVQDVTLQKRNFAGITNIPYCFQTYTVASNAELTLSPGLVLKFAPYSGMTIRKGLIAEGGSTADSNIVFTDIRDDFYGGDSNADSTLSKPTDGYAGWAGIIFADESRDLSCRLRNTIFRHVGYSTGTAAITTQNASPTITYSSFMNCQHGIWASGASNPVINYCDIYNITGFGVNNVGASFVIDARWNWWGSNNGPTVASNPGGTGSVVSTSVNYSPYLGAGASNPVTGDVSLNGTVQAFDASLILKWVVDPIGNPLSPLQGKVADVSGTAGVTSFDASLILQYVVGRIPGFPVEGKMVGTPEDQRVITNALAKTTTIQSLRLSNGSAKRGERFTMTLSADQLADLYGGNIELSFDESRMTPVSVRAVGLAANATTAEYLGASSIRLAFASAEPIHGDGALFEITMEASKELRGESQSNVRVTKVVLNERASSLSAVGAISLLGRPVDFGLDQNYPNPFNPSTTITYRVPDDGSAVKIEVYNMTGQLVRTIVNGIHEAGEYRVTWDASTDAGVKVGSGVYILRISSNTFNAVRKMVLIR